MKTYILTLSKTFMKGHPRCGQPTNFKEKFLAGEKIHTIRKGDYWKLIVHRVNNGSAVLSIREWSGKAYRSKQVEIASFTKLGWESFEVREGKFYLDGKHPTGAYRLGDIAKHDGLYRLDFEAWFEYPKPFIGGIIHFTDFRYGN